MKKFIRFLLVILAGVLLRVPLLAQSYPVQATVQLTPPYSLYLADYTAPGSNRIMANILLKDLSRQDLQTRLRISIEGVGVSIITSPNFRPEPLYLQGGLPIMLTAADLAPYFHPDNLIFQGVSKQEVQKGGTLPEGLYRICIQVLDYNLNAEVSNQACGTAWLILNDPPIINLPAQGEKLRAQEPQNIVFQWTPRHTGSPNAAFSTEYDFQLVELWPDNRDPNNAILSSPPIYETTTFSTSLIYGPAETPLEPGRKYAFRVRARAMTGIEEMNLFKNNGYSEVYSFTYGDACTAPGVVSATTVSSSRVEVRWESAPFHTEFTVRYREKSGRGAKWQEKRTYLSDLVVDGLLPQTEYEFQVLGICGSLTGAASESVSMTTSEEPVTNFTCGAGPDAFDLENQDPLPELKWGDVFKAGDVEVTVLNVKGGNGTFSGTGLAEMPWLRHVKLRVDFSGVYINTDYQLLRGSVNSVFNPDSKMIVNLDGMDELFGGGGEEEVTDPMTDEEIAHEGEIADVSIDPATGAIVVIDEDGKETAYPEEKDEATGERKSVKIVDSSGDTYIVDKNGNVSKGVGSNGATPALVATDEPLDFIIQFSPNERQLYGFDAKNHDAFNNYEKAQLQDEEYPIAWKSIEAGRVDYVNATAAGKSEFPGFIGFKTPTMPMASQPADKEAEKQVNLVGGIAGQTDQLIAFALKEDEKGNEIEHELGLLNVVSYAKVRNKVVLVPVNGASVPANAKQEINAVFAQSVAEWDVVIDAAYTVDPAVLADLDAGESGMLASFPKNMRDFIQTFKKERDEDKNAYYLFIIPGKQSTRAGFMPFKRQFGFIYPENTNNTARTIAHELAHGAFRLRHTFSPEAFIAGQGSTNNLMDYPAGPELRKYQWDNVHEPESMSGWFEDDAEVAMVAFYEEAAHYLSMPEAEGYFDVIKKLNAIKEFFDNCSNSGWTSYENKGIVPECFWTDASVNSNAHHTVSDMPFIAGVIDGGYGEYEGAMQLVQMIKDGPKELRHLSYILAYHYYKCGAADLELSADRYAYLIQQIELNNLNKEYWAKVVAWWNDAEGEVKELEDYWKQCGEAEKLITQINDLYELVTDLKVIVDSYLLIEEEINTYLSTLEKGDNESRYLRGKLVIPVATTFVGVGTVTKITKVKEAIKQLKSFNKWDDFGLALRERVGTLGNIPKRAGKLVDDLSLGKFVNKIGDYDVFENGEVFYRTISKDHYNELLKSGTLKGTGECTTSPFQAFSEDYNGVLVQFKVKRGTIERLEEIGIAAQNNKDVLLKHPNLRSDVSPWNSQYARFKLEKGQVNIALGQGEALKRFNEGIIEFKYIKEIIK